MYQKILDALKNKYKHLGLSEKMLGTMAKKIVRRVGEDESKIETEVDEVGEDLELFQSLADQNRGLKADLDAMKGKTTEDKTPEQKAAEAAAAASKAAEDKKPDDSPEWAKGLLSSIATLTQKVNGYETEKLQKTNSQKLQDKLKELNVSESFYQTFVEGKTFADDSEIESFAQKLKSSEDNYLQANNLKALGDAAEKSVFGKTTKEGELNSSEKAFLQSFQPKEA